MHPIHRDHTNQVEEVDAGMSCTLRLSPSVADARNLRSGVLAAVDVETRDRRLVTLTHAQVLEPIPIDGEVAESWARLRLMLRDRNQRMLVNDSWIAATALALELPVVTQDSGYVDVPGLAVIKV